MRRRVLLYLTLISVSACNGDRAVQPTTSPNAPTNAISDATHGGTIAGNPDFFFLPPMVANPSGSSKWDQGAFNPNLRPTVEICASQALTEATVGSAPCAPLLPSFIATADAGNEQYHVNWKVPSSSTIFYRITVKVGTKQLGFADVETGSNASQLRNVSTGEFIPLVDGRTLPIRFRIEKYALCETPGDPTKPCTSASVDLGTGGTVEAALNPNSPEESGVIIPPQPTAQNVAVSVTSCDTFNPRVTDLPVFGPCVRVTFDPALTTALQQPATVYSCEVFEESVAAGVAGSAQAERIALHELNPQSGRLVALPHAEPQCTTPTTHIGLGDRLEQTIVAVAHGKFSIAAKQVAAMLSPRPAYAAMRFIDLGGGGGTRFGDVSSDDRIPTSTARFSLSAAGGSPTTVRDFQFALPAKFETSAEQSAIVATLGEPNTVQVKVTDLGGEPVRGARVRFSAPEGSSLDSVVKTTNGKGLAVVQWTLTTAGAKTLAISGSGIAGDDPDNGPRQGVDPFQPLQRHWGDSDDDATPVVLSLGSTSRTATTASYADVVVFNDFNVFDDGALGDANNRLLVRNLVGFTGPEPRASKTGVLLSSGHSSYGYECFTSSASAELRSLGYTVAVTTAPEIALPAADVKMLVLCLPTGTWTIAELNSMKQFAAEGGRIVLVSDHQGFGNSVATVNDFLTRMGADMRVTPDAIDCGQYYVAPATPQWTDPILAGLTQLTYGCSSVISAQGAYDSILYYDQTGKAALSGVARISTVPLSSAFRALAAAPQAPAPTPMSDGLRTSPP